MSNLPLQWSIDVHSVHAPLSLSYEANKHELEALKGYAEIENVTSFNSELEVSPLSAGKFKVAGRLKAGAVQASVVDLTPFPPRSMKLSASSSGRRSLSRRGTGMTFHSRTSRPSLSSQDG